MTKLKCARKTKALLQCGLFKEQLLKGCVVAGGPILHRSLANELQGKGGPQGILTRTHVNGTFCPMSYAEAPATRSATLVSTNSLRKRCVRSTNVSLAARQVSNSRLTP